MLERNPFALSWWTIPCEFSCRPVCPSISLRRLSVRPNIVNSWIAFDGFLYPIGDKRMKPKSMSQHRHRQQLNQHNYEQRIHNEEISISFGSTIKMPFETYTYRKRCNLPLVADGGSFWANRAPHTRMNRNIMWAPAVQPDIELIG